MMVFLDEVTIDFPSLFVVPFLPVNFGFLCYYFSTHELNGSVTIGRITESG